MGTSISNHFLPQDQTLQPHQIELPKGLRDKVVVLQCESEKGSCNVYLVGTCHVSPQSCKDVEVVIRMLKPDVVFLELCASRSNVLLPQKSHPSEMPSFTHMLYGLWRNKKSNAFETLGNLVLKKYGKELGVIPGSEFRIACREAEKYGGKIVLGDRPIEITCQRTWSKMKLWYKTKFILMSLLLLASGSITPSDTDTDNRVMDKEFPSMAETLTHERDLYMAFKLLEVARKHNSVVAVVGRAHVAGIQRNWKKPISVNKLMEVEATKSSSSVKLWISMFLAAGGICILSALRRKR